MEGRIPAPGRNPHHGTRHLRPDGRALGDLAAEIAALKSESGGEIMAHGGAAFVQALSRLGLIDEYRLVILPVALGNGLPLFKDLAKPLRVDLAEAKSFPNGTVVHVYQPIRTTG